jgi:hypothetical protein
MTGLELTREERKNLATLRDKEIQIKDAVRSVVKEYFTGVFLWGEGGTGKSWTVLRQLDRSQAKYKLHNTRLTGRGLFDKLEAAPSDIHVIEDAETLLDDKRAWGVLRSALWSQSTAKPMERPVTWGAYQEHRRFIFTGAIIMITQSDPGDSHREIRAMKSRVMPLHLDISNGEIKAKMKKICRSGYTYGEDSMTVEECWKVAAFIISEFKSLHRNLDLRLLPHGFHYYLQWRTGNSVLHWKVRLQSHMQERLVVYQPRRQKKAGESRIALEIYKKPWSGEKKIRVWMKRTGRSKRAFYRALERLA